MTSLLAFGFASPLLLWGLALGGIPIVVHLLHRRRHRETPWAAMRFLMAAIRRNTRRIRLEQLLLLAVRVLILVLLALALAQPHAESFGRYFQADVPTHRLLVIDGSFSMGHGEGGSTRFDRAREIARSIVAGSRQGDAFQLVRIGRTSPRGIITEPAYQKPLVIKEIDQLALTDEPGDLAAAFRESLELLSRGTIARREVYFVTDLQAALWGGGPDGNRDALRELLQKLAEKAQIVILDVGEADAPNGAVVDLALDEPFVATGKPAAVHATLRQFGGAAARGVELVVDGRLAETRKVELAPGAATRVDFSPTFHTPGEHSIEVRLSADGLPLDDRRWLAFPARDELRVLLVNGRPSGRAQESATWYLERALAPATSRQTWGGLTRPSVISEGDLASADLSRFDCVILSNVRLFTDREAELLKAYVHAGGGLIVALGDNVQPENYNQMLYRNGDWALPVPLGDRAGNAKNPQQTFDFDTGELSHPIVQPFQGNPGTGLEAVLTLEYVRLGSKPSGDAEPPRVALRFTNGDPAIVDGGMGRGRVIVFATSADSSWSTWAVQRSFPPMIQEAVRHSVTGRGSDRQLAVGDSLVRTLPNAPAALAATVRLPDGRQKPATVGEEGNVTTVSFDGVDRAGLYELSLGPRAETFAANVDPRESDLAALGPAELRGDLLAGIDFEHRTSWIDPEASASPVTTTQRGGLTRWLLFACLALLLVEQLMAWNFTAGFAALCVAVGLVFLRNAWVWSPAAGGVLLMAFLAAGVWLARRSLAEALRGA